MPCSPRVIEKNLRVPFFEQSRADLHQSIVFVRGIGRISARNAGGEKSFGAIRFHHRRVAPLNRMMRIRIGRDDLSRGAAPRAEICLTSSALRNPLP